MQSCLKRSCCAGRGKVHTMASIPRSWASEATSVSSCTSQLSSLRLRNLSATKQVHWNGRRRKVQQGVIRCSTQEEFSPAPMKEKVAQVRRKKNKDLDLPMESKQQQGGGGAAAASPGDTKRVLMEAKQKYGRAAVAKALQEAKRKLGEQDAGTLALYGGGAALGVLFSGTILTSLEVYPLLPEAMQIVGLACSALVARNVMQGKRETFKVSPVKAVIAIVDGEQKKEQTRLVLPDGLDPTTVAKLERLAEERDAAVNQVEEMKRRGLKLQAEKEAVETVSLQLAEEREIAVSEVAVLKATVESMSGRMLGIEAMLDKEVGLLKSQNQALETVALQLAQERDAAIKETASVRESSAAEKQALEEVAMQLAQERDRALLELENLVKQASSNIPSPAPAPSPSVDPINHITS